MHPIVIPDFFGRAEEMRGEFEKRVGPDRSALPQRFVWDYWHVPGQYTYIRTFAHRFFPAGMYGAFAASLRSWGESRLGCSSFTEPWLSYYVDGCAQEFHSDVTQGPWSFVFSLTRWEERRFTGGETLILAENTLDYWRHFSPNRPLERVQLFDCIPPRFNQLLVFDGRVPHAVARVVGTSDPINSRVALHGWFQEPTVRVVGGLVWRDVEQPVAELVENWQLHRAQLGRINGLMTLRLSVRANGSVVHTEQLASNLVSLDGKGENVTAALHLADQMSRSARFPETASELTTVTIPFIARDR